MLEFLFHIVAGLRACNFIKKRLQHKCFPVKLEKFLRTRFEEHLRTTAYIPNKPLHVHKTLICRRGRHTNVLCMFQLKVTPTRQLNRSYLPNFKTKHLKASWFDTIKYNTLYLNKLI